MCQLDQGSETPMHLARVAKPAGIVDADFLQDSVASKINAISTRQSIVIPHWILPAAVRATVMGRQFPLRSAWTGTRNPNVPDCQHVLVYRAILPTIGVASQAQRVSSEMAHYVGHVQSLHPLLLGQDDMLLPTRA